MGGFYGLFTAKKKKMYLTTAGFAPSMSGRFLLLHQKKKDFFQTPSQKKKKKKLKKK